MVSTRKIAVIIGSNSDLPQCVKGVFHLSQAQKAGNIELIGFNTGSIHRNTKYVLEKVEELIGQVDVIIAGAGWANHLTGTIDAYLRYTLKNDHIVVVGVPFEDQKNPVHSMAAVWSITCVPGTQVVYDPNWGVGSHAFLEACDYSIFGELPKIKLKTAKEPVTRNFEQAILEIDKLSGIID